MPDLLVKLYALPNTPPGQGLAEGIEVRRAIAPERDIVVGFAGSFHAGWAAECATGFGAHPVKVWIATKGDEIVGFACHDVTAIGFFGPTGVAESARQQGIGEALLYATLQAMRAAGHGYAIIGGAGPVDWYLKRLPAMVIPDSEPGIYKGMLHSPDD